jgi:ElaB/YqjD/DUF883 family membrane-anchored ribosome-binding protein
MADKGGTSTDIDSRSEAATGIRSTVDGTPERTGGIAAQLVDAACSVAEALVEEQKLRFGQRVSGIADALRSAVDPLDQSANRFASRYIERAANEAENLSRKVREQRWSELLAETEDLARREPVLYVLGAFATGFLIGRLMGAPLTRPEPEGVVAGSAAQSSQTVVAAVASGSRTAAGERGVETTQAPGAEEIR